MAMKYYLLMLLLVSTLITDIVTHKIKNVVILPFLFGGVLLNVYLAGLSGLYDSLLAGLIPVLLLGLFYVLNMLGAGNIKLFAAIGAIMGANFIIKSLFYSALTGGFIAVIILLLRRNAKERMRNLLTYLKHCFLTRSLLPYSSFAGSYDDSKFPYTYVIATGTMIALLII